jgi:hypothetical protein
MRGALSALALGCFGSRLGLRKSLFGSGFLSHLDSPFRSFEFKLTAFCGYTESTVGGACICRKAYFRFVDGKRMRAAKTF